MMTITSKFGQMLSVGAIRFEDRFCASRKGGTGGGGWVGDSAWWLLQLAVEKPWSFEAALVSRSVLLSEGPDY